MEKYKRLNDEPRKCMPNYSKRTTAHDHGAAEMHTGESLGVPPRAGTAEGGWDQTRYPSSCTSPYKSAWSCKNLPSLNKICSVVWYLYVQHMFCSFLAHPGTEILWLMCSGKTPPNSVWWHQCMWEEKQDLCRNGNIGYTGCLLNVLGTFTVHFLQTALVDLTFVKAD